MRVLVVCNSSRSIVRSAKNAGYTVYALDNFGDVDMRMCADRAEFLGSVPRDRIYELVRSLGEFDAVVLGPGFEKLKFRNILNNRLPVMEEVNDKLKIAKRFESMDIPHPSTELLTEASWSGFPLMIKPRFGSGGIQNITARDGDELANLKARDDACDFIVQEFVEGVPCSASLIGTGDDAVVVALNEQLIGIPSLTRLPFAYCGNITPFRTEFGDEMVQYAERIAREFGLVGSNGIDFILTGKGAVVLEINPRFQGSLDTVELSTGLNVFDAHVKSFTGELPQVRDFSRFAARAILYANKRLVIDRKLSEKLTGCMNANNAADIPHAGRVIPQDEPVATFLGWGETRETALGNAGKYAYTIRAMTEA